MDKEQLILIMEDYLSVSDEWGGSKLANWKWGYNVVVDGLDDTADAIIEQSNPNIKRIPLTKDQILELNEEFGWFQYGDAQGAVTEAFVRKIEKIYGIK